MTKATTLVRTRFGRVVATVLLAASAAACGGRSDTPTTTPQGAILQVTIPGGVTGALMAKVRSVPGVTSATAVTVAPVRVETAGGRAAQLRVAEVEPVAFDALAPQLLGTGNVAAPLGEGAFLLSSDERNRLGLRDGEILTVRPARGSAARIRVASIETRAPFADGIVGSGHAAWLGGAKPTLLFVGVVQGADQGRVASALAARMQNGVSFAGPQPSFYGRTASRLFGSFTYVVHKNGAIAMSPQWIRANILWRKVPVLGWVRCHRLMLPQLARALREIERAHLTGLIDIRDFHTAGGCFVARTILWDPSNPPSMHAWGLAIDFNVSRNRYGARPTQDPRIVAIFKKWGFRWGGDWAIPDGMHFELAALLAR